MRWTGCAIAIAAIVWACSGDDFTTGGESGAAQTGGSGGEAASGGTTAGGGGSGTGGTGAGGASGAGGSGAGGSGAGGSGAGGSGTGGVGGNPGQDGGAGTGGAGTGGAVGCPAPVITDTSQLELTGSVEYPVVSGGKLYFTADSHVWVIPAFGSKPVEIDSSGADNEGIAISGTKLAWADRPAATLRRRDPAGGQELPDVAGETGIQTVVADDTYFYWAASSGIRRVELTGTTPELLHTGSAYALAISGDELFWIRSIGEIYRSKKDGSGTKVLLGQQANPYGGNWSNVSIAVDGTHVYFTAMLQTPPDGGAPKDGIWRVPRSGGQIEEVGLTPGAEGIALTSGCIYWGSRHVNGRVYVRSKQLGAGGFLSTQHGTWPRGLALDEAGTTLYILDSLARTVARAVVAP